MNSHIVHNQRLDLDKEREEIKKNIFKLDNSKNFSDLDFLNDMDDRLK
jgi:hypothetical protein